MFSADEYIEHTHPAYFENLYRQYKEDPLSVDESWRKFFEGFELGVQSSDSKPDEHLRKEFLVLELIQAYRTRGHLFTKTNPVRQRRKYTPTLDIENFGLSQEDLDTIFHAGETIGIGPARLKDIIAHLDETYCRSLGAEYMFIRVPERVRWLQERMESSKNQPQLTLDEKKQILHKLNQAVVFEMFLHKRYLGQKRFSLQGNETLIPGLDFLIDSGAELGVSEFLIGMPHRGRLNVLANILNKTYEEIFAEFEDYISPEGVFAGDVKYHLGYTSRLKTHHNKEVLVGLAPNPSHLEAIDPVIEGMARAKIDHQYQGDVNKVVPILIHGDAAIAGQGVVYEVIQMSLLNGYSTGGTIHIVINNQLGFTTNYLEGRSSTYCTDVAKVTLSPVFHVNADDAEAVVHAVRLAMAYRQTFHTDVFIDLLGYRKFGHNEGDEPRFTQPKLYKIIEKHPDPREIYYHKLLERSEIERGLAEKMEKEFQDLLFEKLNWVREKKVTLPDAGAEEACEQKKRQKDQDFFPLPRTAVSKKALNEVAQNIFTIPADFEPFSKIKKIYEERLRRFNEGKAIDWAMAEALSFGTLLKEGVPVRLSGQDSKRGTFAHRHAELLSEVDETPYVPLQHVDKNQAPFFVYNSPLSEYGVMGFEYGYACALPEGLTIWEAQYGDFTNGAQIVIDEFLTGAEKKWQRSNGLVLFLPHGYEGHGPDHSSARIERFLMLAAENNMRLANCTTPANFFHLLRSQVKFPFRAPLVVFTPKSLLRHPECVSSVDEFVKGKFQPVIGDSEILLTKVRRVLLCSGKFYYDLKGFREQQKIEDVAIVRIEQLYPFPHQALKAELKKFKNVESIWWVQEEPENAGALWYIERTLKELDLHFVSRPASAVPAIGSHQKHLQEQKELLTTIFKVD